ncbi:phosphoribosyltransferase domain-containing protein [Clostridium nigeriense]|uniref:phosphoribosyltransferase domain-containing protein n=1 Tax=Clostridium nigeriense TaxID=1805470 RepID=UPI000834616F|nr:phosphoribosyltransferase domain-containing protein [Clostridium nigeriense]
MKINIKENIYGIDINRLVFTGYRENNSKRNFLFISKVLGKHLEVRPDVCKAIGVILASTIFAGSEEIKSLVSYINNPEININIENGININYRSDEKIAVLGFAETATGLGMAVASTIEGSYYITTTRENIKNIKSLFNFEEEHSHATTHNCFPIEPYKLKNVNRIILVDDEITTGKSMINIIRELIRTTGVKNYTILSILDWRNFENRELYEVFKKEKGINIEVKSLISGEIENENNKIYYDTNCKITNEIIDITNLNILQRFGEYFKFTGRFGITFEEIKALEEDCLKIANEIQKLIEGNEKILVLGHGENIYIPSRIAAYIKGDVYFKSTTRSSIYCSNEEKYLLNEKSSFYHNGVKYYFYNKSYIENNYDKVVLIVEDDLKIKLTNNLIIVKP